MRATNCSIVSKRPRIKPKSHSTRTEQSGAEHTDYEPRKFEFLWLFNLLNTSVNMCSTINFHLKAKMKRKKSKEHFILFHFVRLLNSNISSFDYYIFLEQFKIFFVRRHSIHFNVHFCFAFVSWKCRRGDQDGLSVWFASSFEFCAAIAIWLKFYLNESIRIYIVTSFKWIVNDPYRFGPSTTSKKRNERRKKNVKKKYFKRSNSSGLLKSASSDAAKLSCHKNIINQMS